MKTLFKTSFWLLVVFSAITVDNASMKQIAYEAFTLAILIILMFYYEDFKTYLK